jgi:hypothetical protein
MADYYRGGPGLLPQPRDVRIDPVTGLLDPGYGVSVRDRPDGLEKYGGAYRVAQLPPELRIIQRGLRPFHYEIVPVQPMTLAEYIEALNKVVLVPP